MTGFGVTTHYTRIFNNEQGDDKMSASYWRHKIIFNLILVPDVLLVLGYVLGGTEFAKEGRYVLALFLGGLLNLLGYVEGRTYPK